MIYRKKKFEVYELLFSGFIIVGMSMVLSFEFQYVKGIVFGIIGAFLASLFTVLNSKFVEDHRPSQISFYELMGGAITILVISFIVDPSFLMTSIPSSSDLYYLMLLGVVATAFAFVVSIQIMKNLSPFTVSLTINLEPLYGILLSLVIFGEEEMMSGGFYAGFVIILMTILANAYFKKKKRLVNSE
jgi:drug/metabolite transporter (DMT)-like permease